MFKLLLGTRLQQNHKVADAPNHTGANPLQCSHESCFSNTPALTFCFVF